MYIEYDNISNPIRFTIDTILKEAKEESRLVKQILYTMLSSYTNNPINLAINSPSGEGKTYVLQKVGEVFPKQDTMFLAGMTEKALFHRPGVLVVKNEVGEYTYTRSQSQPIAKGYWLTVIHCFIRTGGRRWFLTQDSLMMHVFFTVDATVAAVQYSMWSRRRRKRNE